MKVPRADAPRFLGRKDWPTQTVLAACDLDMKFTYVLAGTEPHYDLHTMTNIILACCILHNSLSGVDNDDSLIEEVDRELLQQDIQVSASQVRDDDHRLGSHIRDTIENKMWQDYVNN